MPVWHNATRKWTADGRLAVLGITQEQHPDRCRLFAQWQGFDWPIVGDPINSIESTAVPIIVAIDEFGIVRLTQPRPESFEREFLDITFRDDPAGGGSSAPVPPARPDLTALRLRAEQDGSALAWRDWGDACLLWGGEAEVDSAVRAYTQVNRLDPADANTLFRLGVAYRLRHDSAGRQSADFQRAVDFWEQALAREPNQYIWRRRIQQYGPRLDKPYSFYDWVDEARREITARGETPLELSVNPQGAELARPVRTFAADAVTVPFPDPDGRIQHDSAPLISAEVTLVPSRVSPGGTARVHLSLTPDPDLLAHWNNESEPLRVWIEPPPGWLISQSVHSVDGPAGQATSSETRRLDFEIQAPADASGIVTLPASALYYVCEDETGACRYVRQDISIRIEVMAVPAESPRSQESR